MLARQGLRSSENHPEETAPQIPEGAEREESAAKRARTNEEISVPSFISILVQIYKEICHDKLAQRPIDDHKIKIQVKKDLRKTFKSMMDGVITNLYRNSNM